MKARWIPLLGSAVALAATGLALRAQAAPAAKRPNIVHIIADDLGWKDVGFNGATDIKTPNLDKLAAEGARMTQFYVQPMCTPTRAAVMTGRYPFRYGLQTAVIPSVSDYGLDKDEWLMPQALHEAGYKTAIIGKWHLGHGDRAFWPKQRGFDYQYGALVGEIDYFTHDDRGVLDWFRDNQPLKETGYSTTLIGDDAVRYIDAQDGSAPFYLYLTFNAPHTPYQAPQEYIERYAKIADPTRRTYAAMVDCLDEQIGRVVTALQKKGLRDNTLIVFHSDNGGVRDAMYTGVLADVSKIKLPADNGPYREGKATTYEGGTRVCAVADWPGHVKHGDVNGIIHAVDLYTTFAGLGGASTAKAKKPLDGLDVWETIAAGKASPRTEVVYNLEPMGAALRQGDWKLVWKATLPSRTELFDLANDPSEKNDLSRKDPARVAAMQARLDELAKDAAKPLFLIDQFKVVMKNMHGQAVIPIDPEYNTADQP